jgi:hypothetical protein
VKGFLYRVPRFSTKDTPFICLPSEHLKLCQVHCLLRTAAETKERIKNVLAIYFPILLNFRFFPPFYSFTFPAVRLYPVSGTRPRSQVSGVFVICCFLLALRRNCVYKRISPIIIWNEECSITRITLRRHLYKFIYALGLGGFDCGGITAY